MSSMHGGHFSPVSAFRIYRTAGLWLTSDRRRLAEIADSPRGSRTTDVLTALCLAVQAKPVLLAVDNRGEMGIGHLQVIYYREVGWWPEASTADALLVEAANVAIVERHMQADQELNAQARFVLGVAAMLRVSPRQETKLGSWIQSLGLRLADAEAYYAQRSEQQFWLHIDLGPEPGPWPKEVSWMLLSRDSDMAGESVPCTATENGLKLALREVIRHVQRVAPNLIVDLAVPRALMDKGIERWPLVEVDGQLEPLGPRYQPRLRWSQRRRNRQLERSHSERVQRTDRYWGGPITTWLCNDSQQSVPCLITGAGGTVQPDPLRGLLRDGCGFLIWFPTGAEKSAATRIDRAVRDIKGPARRIALPDHLPAFAGQEPAVIWDDPVGRGLISLPPSVAPESP